MAWNFTASLLSTVNTGTGLQLLDESNEKLFKAALDEVKTVLAKTPIQGSKYFMVRNVDKNNYSSKKIHGIGLAQVNSDGAPLPVDKQIMGFEQTISNYVLRNSMSITREVLETDRFGEIGQHAKNLIQSGEKTIERILADAVNRGFGDDTDTNLSMLAEDGLGLFADTRPFARASISGSWDNHHNSALTADAVATARLNLRQYVDLNGDLAPQQLMKVVVSPDQEDTMREISGTTLKVDTSLNTTNIVSGIAYETWDWLTDSKVVFIGDGPNELEFHIRKSPTTETWQDGNNPDVINSRLRMALGTGVKCAGNMIGLEVA